MTNITTNAKFYKGVAPTLIYPVSLGSKVKITMITETLSQSGTRTTLWRVKSVSLLPETIHNIGYNPNRSINYTQ